MADSLRITQQRIETVGHNSKPGLRTTQHGVEQVLQPNNTQNLFCTQHAVEILLGPATAYTDGGFTVAPYSY